MDMDPIEEFEFRPLTEGLGFHKKPPLKFDESPNKLAGLNFAPTQELAAAPLPERSPLTKIKAPEPGTPTNFNFSTPAAKPSAPSAARPASPSNLSFKLDGTALAPAKTETLKSETSKPKTAERLTTFVEPRLMPIAFNLSAALVDGTIVLAMSILFLIAVLTVTKVDLLTLLVNIQVDPMTQASVTLLLFAVAQIYVVVLRGFWGRTLGEWAFDSQLGSVAQQRSLFYPLLVLWRSVVIMATGLVVLPLLSAICQRDLAAYLTGLQLYERRDG